MLVVAFIQWWYGPGWQSASKRVLARVRHTYLDFSVPILLRTLASPWRRIITAGGGTLSQRAKAVLDNAISRCVGFTVRLIALFIALGIMAVTLVVGGIIALIWPAIPVLGFVLVVAGIVL